MFPPNLRAESFSDLKILQFSETHESLYQALINVIHHDRSEVKRYLDLQRGILKIAIKKQRTLKNENILVKWMHWPI